MNRLVRTELLKQRTTRTFVFGDRRRPWSAPRHIANYSVAGSRATNRSARQLRPGPRRAGERDHGDRPVARRARDGRRVPAPHGDHHVPRHAAPGPRVVAKLVAHALTGAAHGVGTLAAAGLVAVPWLASSDVAVDSTATS